MMRLVRWTPREAAARERVLPFEQLADELWRDFRPVRPASYASDTVQPVLRPAMDVVESENEIVIRVDLPGLTADDLNVQVDGDLLTISGEIKHEDKQNGERYHYRERSYGAFKRSLRLGETVDGENIDATFDNGVLSLTLPKRPEAQPKQIQVKKA